MFLGWVFFLLLSSLLGLSPIEKKEYLFLLFSGGWDFKPCSIEALLIACFSGELEIQI